MTSPNRKDTPHRIPVPEVEDPESSRPPPDEAQPRVSGPGAPGIPGLAGQDPDDPGPRQVIEQAARDIRRGLRDTDQHGIPSDVPGPGIPPERSPGAAVPEEGVDVAAYSRSRTRKRKSPGA